MPLSKAANEVNKRMVELSQTIDRDNEAARLQGSVLAGGLLGGWIVAGGVEIGYSPVIAAIMLTVGVVGGIAVRIMV